MFIAQPADSAEATSLYKGSVDAQGYVTNLVRAWAWRPEVFEGFAALRNQLMSQSRLSKRDYAVMAVIRRRRAAGGRSVGSRDFFATTPPEMRAAITFGRSAAAS